MLFYDAMSQNPDFLIDLFSEADVQQIAQIIHKQNDAYICSRISFELALGGSSKDELQQPIIISSFDVLNETYLRTQKYSEKLKDLNDLHKNLTEVQRLLSQQNVKASITNSGTLSDKAIEDLKQRITPVETALESLFFDIHGHTKASRENWGTLGRYKIFIRMCADLYSELTDQPFTAAFHKSQKDSDPSRLTSGTDFVFIFHSLLNRLSEKYGGQIFSNKNFATACVDVRKDIRREAKQQKSLRNFK